MALAQRASRADIVSSKLPLKAIGGVNAHLKIPTLVAGMVAGANSIDDVDLLRRLRRHRRHDRSDPRPYQTGRRGGTNSAHGAARLVADALVTKP